MSAQALQFNLEYRTLIEGMYLARAVGDQMKTFRSDSWISSASLDAIPGEVLAESATPSARRFQRLVRVGDALVHLHLHELSVSLRVAAVDTRTCEAALSEVKRALPVDDGEEEAVPIRFWWWRGHSSHEMAQTMPAPDWDTISLNYAERTLTSLGPLMSWQSVPRSGGRLVLWHGSPGTGKTTAIRALARKWRSWAEFQFITDPEQFLSNPGYLLETVSDEFTSADPDASGPDWRVLVLEDAGEYLAPDAKQLAGQGLSRLLNVCDGVLGQATRSLVLVTTNEPLRSLHPALSRSGRCLAETEFYELGRTELECWCDSRQLVAPGVQSASLADLFAHADGRLELAPSPGFGFAAA